MRWVCDVCGSVESNPKFIGALANHDIDNCNGTHRRTYTRDDMVRAIVGQQWAEAMRYHLDVDYRDPAFMSPFVWTWRYLPCAVDVVGDA